jgi:hypothetical protein
MTLFYLAWRLDFTWCNFGQEGSLVFEGSHRLRSVDNIEIILADEPDIIQGDIVNAPWEGKYYRGQVQRTLKLAVKSPQCLKGSKG